MSFSAWTTIIEYNQLRFLRLNSKSFLVDICPHGLIFYHFSLPPNHRQPELLLSAVAASSISWSRADFFSRRACTSSSTDCIDSSNFWSSAILAWKGTLLLIYSAYTTTHTLTIHYPPSHNKSQWSLHIHHVIDTLRLNPICNVISYKWKILSGA